MVQQSDEFYASVRNQVCDHARNLARRWQLDEKRIYTVLERTAIDCCGNRGASIEEGKGLLFQPDLEYAVDYMAPDEALELFEKNDADELAKKIAIFDYLADRRTPLYSLCELKDLLESAILHLERNREHMIQTGLPRYSISGSFFFESRLKGFYPVKVPCAIKKCSISDTMDAYEYVWSAKQYRFPSLPVTTDTGYCVCSPDVSVGEDGCIYEGIGQNSVEEVPYEDVPFMEGISADDVKRLEDMRECLFDTRMAILRELLAAISDQKVEMLWDRCASIIIERLMYEDADFLLRTDKLCGGFDLRDPLNLDANDNNICPQPGFYGFTDLLWMIGHCEEELSISMYAQACNKLQEAFPVEPYQQASQDTTTRVYVEADYDKIPMPPKFLKHAPRASVVSNYFEAIGTFGIPASEIDAILISFEAAWQPYNDFWKSYASRVNRTIEEECHTMVVTKSSLPRKLAAEFETSVISFAELSRQSMVLTGKPVAINSVAVSVGITDSLSSSGHGPDFRAVNWRGHRFSFTVMQARAIELLWEAHVNNTPELSQKHILETMETTQTRLRDLFKNHPAWNTMIRPGKTKGTFYLDI